MCVCTSTEINNNNNEGSVRFSSVLCRSWSDQSSMSTCFCCSQSSLAPRLVKQLQSKLRQIEELFPNTNTSFVIDLSGELMCAGAHLLMSLSLSPPFYLCYASSFAIVITFVDSIDDHLMFSDDYSSYSYLSRCSFVNCFPAKMTSSLSDLLYCPHTHTHTHTHIYTCWLKISIQISNKNFFLHYISDFDVYHGYERILPIIFWAFPQTNGFKQNDPHWMQ